MDKLDFKIDTGGDVVLANNNIELIYGRDIYVQAFRQILLTRRTEYFLNLNEGLRFEVFLGRKELDEDEAVEALREAATQIEDFVKFTRIEFNFDRLERTLYIDFEALFADGYILNFNEELMIGA